MSYGLRLSLIFTAVCWLVVIGGVIALPCGEPAGVYLVLGVGPAALVGAIATFIEWRSEREHKTTPANDGDVHRVG